MHAIYFRQCLRGACLYEIVHSHLLSNEQTSLDGDINWFKSTDATFDLFFCTILYSFLKYA